MRKRWLMLLSLLFLVPGVVHAGNPSVNISVSCGSVETGSTTTCTAYANASGGTINNVSGSYLVTGNISLVSLDSSNGFGGGSDASASYSSFGVYGNEVTGSVKLFTITVRGNTAGSGTVKVSVTGYGSDSDDYSVSLSGTGKVQVTDPVTQPITEAPTTPATTRRTTQAGSNVTANANATTTTIPVTTVEASKLYFTSLTVDNFPVTETNGIYYVTTDTTTENVTIAASAPDGVTIVGTGTRVLSYGKNTVSLILKDTNGGVATFTLVITRPDNSSNYNTLLKNLAVVGYKFVFDPATTSYTITVPDDATELYILAEAQSEDVNVVGNGVLSLASGENTAYVTVSYGDLSSTAYTIHIKRSHKSLIMWIVIGTLGIGLFATLLLEENSKKKKVSNLVAEKEKILAEKNRLVVGSQDEAQLKVNGSSAVGIGSRVVNPIVSPTPVMGVSTEAPKKVIPIKIIKKRVASPGMAPMVKPVNNLSMIDNVEPQVKVVKKMPKITKVIKRVIVPNQNN